ncbi:hypothetical protein AB4K20DRAFT_1871885 [Rhizopus microsporus]
MYKDSENIEAGIAASQVRAKQSAKQLIAYTFEYEAKNQLDEQAESSGSSSKQIKIRIVECDNVFVHGMELSVGSIIKSEASHLRKCYHTLNAHHKAIVTLGLNSIIDLSFDSPDVQRNSDENWKALYKKVKDLETNYDPGFCRGDTYLTLHDTIKDLAFKADMRILHDRVSQHHNVEIEVGTVEAAEEDSGDVKFNRDRCKMLIQNKAVVDRYLMKDCFVDNDDSLQICSLEVFLSI